jgi:recombinase
MAKIERVREVLSQPLSPEFLEQKAAAGWKPVAVEWQREVEAAESPGTLVEDVPFGLKIAEDCERLVENPNEKQALMLIMEKVVLDSPMSEIADELNRRGFRTRQGLTWNEVSVFDMLPRLIDVGPQLLSGEEWVERRRRLVLSTGGASTAGYSSQDRPRH